MLNYLQNMQQQGQPQQGMMPQQGAISQAMPQQQAPSNPFDVGIRRAIESARESLGMTEKQQEKALRRSMLAFGQNIAEQPKQKGFWNNLGSAGRALAPAIMEYDNSEDQALTQNNALANQILAYQAAEEQRNAQAEERDWKRDFAERQFEEQKRGTNLLDRFRNLSLENRSEKHGGDANDEGLSKLLNTAEELVKDSGNKGERSKLASTLNKYSPLGYRLNEKQSEINAVGDVLRGQLNKAWGYKNQAEFEHIPSISSDNSQEANLAIIKQLKSLLLKHGGDENQIPQQNINALAPVESNPVSEGQGQEYIRMYNPNTGAESEVHNEDLEEAQNRGWEIR